MTHLIPAGNASQNPHRRTFLTRAIGVAASSVVGGAALGAPIAGGKSKEAILEGHLVRTEERARPAVEMGLKPMRDLFTVAKANTGSFADYALGWKAKYHLLRDYVPYTSGDTLKKYLESLVSRFFFTKDSIQRALEQGVARFSGHIEEVENKMLVALVADISDLPGNIRPDLGTPSAFGIRFRETISDTKRFAAKWNGVEAGVLVAGGLAGSVVQNLLTAVISRVLAKCATSGALLGGGGMAGPLGLVAALVVDCLISWLVNWWCDPRGNLSRELARKLGEMETLILEGQKPDPGIRETLSQVLDARNKLRRASLEWLVLGKK